MHSIHTIDHDLFIVILDNTKFWKNRTQIVDIQVVICVSQSDYRYLVVLVIK